LVGLDAVSIGFAWFISVEAKGDVMEREQVEREHCYSESAYVQDNVVRLHHLYNLKQPIDVSDDEWDKVRMYVEAFIGFIEGYIYCSSLINVSGVIVFLGLIKDVDYFRRQCVCRSCNRAMSFKELALKHIQHTIEILPTKDDEPNTKYWGNRVGYYEWDKRDWSAWARSFDKPPDIDLRWAKLR
jgi:hypothetical protein